MGSSDRFFENKYIIGNIKNIKGKINVIFAFLFIDNIDLFNTGLLFFDYLEFMINMVYVYCTKNILE